MKIRGRNIKRRLYGRVSVLKNRLVRAPYFRGHGVHSPFVYDIVRQVFMCHSLISTERTLHNALRQQGVSERRAIELQNLYIHCNYKTFGVDCADADLCIMTCNIPLSTLSELLQEVASRGATAVVMSPYNGRAREESCRRIVAEHPSTSVDNRGYLLIFNNYLPKQHFRL